MCSFLHLWIVYVIRSCIYIYVQWSINVRTFMYSPNVLVRTFMYLFLHLCIRAYIYGSRTLRKLYFHFLSRWMGYDIMVTVYPSILNQMEFHLVQKIERKTVIMISYPIQRERKWKYSFLSVCYSYEHLCFRMYIYGSLSCCSISNYLMKCMLFVPTFMFSYVHLWIAKLLPH